MTKLRTLNDIFKIELKENIFNPYNILVEQVLIRVKKEMIKWIKYGRKEGYGLDEEDLMEIHNITEEDLK